MIQSAHHHSHSTPPAPSGSSRPASVARPQFQFDPWILWVTFRRCWPWAVPTGGILAALVAFFVLETFVPTYRASHLLEANQDYVVFKGVMPTVSDLARTEKQLFYNPIVLDPVLSDESLRKAPSLSDPEKAESNLRRNLSISNGGNRARLVVSYDDTDRDAAADVCNAVVESYLRQRDLFDDTRMTNLEKWLEPEIERWQNLVEDRQRDISKLSKMLLGYTPGQRVAVIEDQSKFQLLTDLRGQITDLKVELALVEAQQATFPVDSAPKQEFIPPQVNVERPVPTEAAIEQLVDADTEVIEARARINRYKAMLASLEDQDLVRVRREYYEETVAKRDEWAEKLASIEAAARERAVEILEKRADEAFKIAQLNAQREVAAMKAAFENEQNLGQQTESFERTVKLEEMRTRLAVLEKQYDTERSRLEQFGGASAELQFAQDDLMVANGVLTRLRDRLAAIKTERRQEGAVRSLAEAKPPTSPVETIPLKKISLFSGAAFLFPFLLGLLWEFRIQRVTDSSAVERTLVPVVGEVAKLPSGTRAGSRGRRMFEESVDTLRANLFLSLETKNTRSIAVVSSMSAEGKSSVASQLALSIAKASGETVLLVDADLRCPDQHDIFGLEMGPGLSGVLSKTAKFEDAVDSSLGDLVHIMPAGPLNCSPHRLMNQASVKEFVDHALERYSVVIFDTAPVLAAGETMAVAAAVDTTLLCVMRDVSRMEHVSRTTRRLEAAGASIAGTVFSGVATRQYAYRYGDYHYAAAGDISS